MSSTPNPEQSDLQEILQNFRRLEEKFDTYQKANDAVVRLSFGLLVSATVALSISALTLIVKFLTS